MSLNKQDEFDIKLYCKEGYRDLEEAMVLAREFDKHGSPQDALHYLWPKCKKALRMMEAAVHKISPDDVVSVSDAIDTRQNAA